MATATLNSGVPTNTKRIGILWALEKTNSVETIARIIESFWPNWWTDRRTRRLFMQPWVDPSLVALPPDYMCIYQVIQASLDYLVSVSERNEPSLLNWGVSGTSETVPNYERF
ncbi:hypothetical protein VTO42DRAFT_6689 [Malbranchea cinnamomea]